MRNILKIFLILAIGLSFASGACRESVIVNAKNARYTIETVTHSSSGSEKKIVHYDLKLEPTDPFFTEMGLIFWGNENSLLAYNRSTRRFDFRSGDDFPEEIVVSICTEKKGGTSIDIETVIIKIN